MEKRYSYLDPHRTVFIEANIFIFNQEDKMFFEVIVDGQIKRLLNMEYNLEKEYLHCGNDKNLNLIYPVKI